MNKTYNINLGGYPFTINDDAYNLLDSYLTTLHTAFDKVEEKREIVGDIEERIAEILNVETANGSRIVAINLIQDIIERIGQPQDMEEMDMEPESDDDELPNSPDNGYDHDFTTPPPPPQMPKLPKRLYRNPDNKMVGGVCSGLAAFFNVDVTWIRLAWVVLALMSIFIGKFFIPIGFIILTYVVLWICIPLARTPLQKMEMYSQEPTMQNIGKSVTDEFSSRNCDTDNGYGNHNQWFIIASMALKILIILGGAAVAISIISGMILAPLMTIEAIHDNSNLALHDSDVVYVMIALYAWALTLLIPLFILCRTLLKGILNLKGMSKAWRNTTIIAWIVSIITAITFTAILTKSQVSNILKEEKTQISHSVVIESISESDSYIIPDNDSDSI